ncbi:hypothetical protein SMU76_07148 [Streptococcus mutans N66]|nr:hypothetical protein SMU76_07148 [Streptococcus mutans N66]
MITGWFEKSTRKINVQKYFCMMSLYQSDRIQMIENHLEKSRVKRDKKGFGFSQNNQKK